MRMFYIRADRDLIGGNALWVMRFNSSVISFEKAFVPPKKYIYAGRFSSNNKTIILLKDSDYEINIHKTNMTDLILNYDTMNYPMVSMYPYIVSSTKNGLFKKLKETILMEEHDKMELFKKYYDYCRINKPEWLI